MVFSDTTCKWKMEGKKDISILIVSYNTRDLTLDCIRSIYELTEGVSFEIIVIDNSSTDGSTDAIRKEFPEVFLVCLEDNLGFGKANNLAARYSSGKYLLLINPDTVVLGDTVKTIYKFAENNRYAGIYGGRVITGDGEIDRDSCRHTMTLWTRFCYVFGLAAIFKRNGLFNMEHYGSWTRDCVREVDILSGCFILIRKDVWCRLGGFDENYYMYGEDTDICFRAKKKGYRCLFTPDAEIKHYGGESETTRENKMVHLLKANATFIKKHWNRHTGWLGISLLWLLALRRMIKAYFHGLLSRDHGTEEFGEWKKIWRKRKIWLKGYPLQSNEKK